MKDTRTDLVAELEALLPSCGATKVYKIRSICDRARAGEFHDFKSEHAAPKCALVDALRDASLNTVAARVIDGEFDETVDAEDQAALALELKDEPAIRRVLKLPDPVKS